MRMRYIRYGTFMALLSIFSFSSGLYATNGTHPTAYGARAAGMGGATLAVGGSAMDLQANPSQLARMKKGMFEVGGTLVIPSLVYEDSLIDWIERDPYLSYVNKTKSEKAIFPIPYVAYAAPIGKNMGWGIAFYGQAGVGAEFKGTKRPLAFPGQRPVSFQSFFPNQDMGIAGKSKLITENTFSNLSIARLTPGFAMKFGMLSIGVAADISIAEMEFRFTMSDPSGSMEMPGAGFRYKSDRATALGGKVSFTLDLTENLTFSYAYQSKSRYNLNGRMSINAGQGQFNVNALGQNVALANQAGWKTSFYLEEPEEHTVGLAIKAGALTIGIDVGYIKWSNSYKSMDFRFEQPVFQTPIGNYLDNMSFNVYWEDQRVYAIGFEYKPGATAYRFGYNYGKSPVQATGLNPIFPALTEHHLSGGIGFDFSGWGLDFAAEYAFPATIKGSSNNDWAMFHALYGSDFMNPKDNKMPFYSQSMTMRQLNLSVGAKWYL